MSPTRSRKASAEPRRSSAAVARAVDERAVFVGLLRAVNVGGTGKLAMADLVTLCKKAGLIELDESVSRVVRALKERGFESPHLKNFVVARINPLRFSKEKTACWDATIDKMLASAAKFDASKIRPDQVARSGAAED